MSERTNVSRLVTFLGTGNYQPVRYGLGERMAAATPWVALALQELLDPAPDETLVLATDTAWEKNGTALCEAFERAGRRPPRRVRIAEGRSEAELWEQFQRLKEELRGAAHVVLDITHAYRHQPFFAAGVTAFVRSVDREPPEIRVVYGAFEMRTERESGEQVAPVVELTPFVDLVDWTHDLILLLESGRLGRLIRRMRAPGRVLREKWQNGVKLASALEAFARDLQTIRTGSLLLGGADDSGRRSPSSARTLLEAVERARADVEAYLPPLADVLDRIRDMAKPLVFDGEHLAGAAGQPVLAALIDLYLAMGRYVEAVTALREAHVSAWSPPAAARPGLPDFDEGEREFIEKVVWYREDSSRVESLGQLRNDIDHAGYRRGALEANKLIENIETQAQDYRSWQPPETPHEKRIFVNISNHPSAEWSEEQRRAALDLAGEIRDIPFPEVGPDWSLKRLRREADALVKELPEGTTHAMVQGEFTLTMELVRRLQEKGIRCVAATTERRVEKTGDGREGRSFRFVRFRDYPLLS